MAKSEFIKLRVDTDRKARYNALAKAAGMSLSEWILSRLDMKGGGLHDNRETAQNADSLQRFHDVAGEAHPRKQRAANRADHDSKNCRLYGCLVCKFMGVHNLKRGLP